jgi:hypothetical protein
MAARALDEVESHGLKAIDVHGLVDTISHARNQDVRLALIDVVELPTIRAIAKVRPSAKVIAMAQPRSTVDECEAALAAGAWTFAKGELRLARTISDSVHDAVVERKQQEIERAAAQMLTNVLPLFESSRRARMAAGESADRYSDVLAVYLDGLAPGHALTAVDIALLAKAIDSEESVEVWAASIGIKRATAYARLQKILDRLGELSIATLRSGLAQAYPAKSFGRTRAHKG